MKINKIGLFIASAAALLISTTPLHAEMQPEGLNNKVEWTLNQTWKIPAGTIDFTYSLDKKYGYFLTADQKVYVYSHAGQQLGFVPVPEGVNKIDIAPQGETLYLLDSKKNAFFSVAIDFVVNVDTTGSPIKGKVDAPVTIAIFTDFECPYCSKIVPLMDQVYEANRKNVKIVFKNMPLNFHKNAEPAARAALAAEAQGKFWEYHDILFEKQKELSPALYEKTAKELGLDMAKFKADMNSAATKSKVEKDKHDAKLAGVTGTPSVFINGRALKQRSLQGFQMMIDAELKKAGLQ